MEAESAGGARAKSEADVTSVMSRTQRAVQWCRSCSYVTAAEPLCCINQDRFNCTAERVKIESFDLCGDPWRTDTRNTSC